MRSSFRVIFYQILREETENIKIIVAPKNVVFLMLALVVNKTIKKVTGTNKKADAHGVRFSPPRLGQTLLVDPKSYYQRVRQLIAVGI